MPDVNYEIIVVEDCGNDGTIEMMTEKFPDISLLKNTTNMGSVRSRCRAIEQAKGAYFFAIDSDIEMQPETYEALKEYIDSDLQLGFVTCNKRSLDGTHQQSHFNFPTLTSSIKAMFPKRRYQDVVKSEEKHAHECHPEWISTGHSLIRRQAWEECGGQSKDIFFFGEEIDFCHNLKKNNWKIGFIPHMGFIHHGSVSQRGEIDRFRKMSWLGSIYLADLYWPKWQALILRLLYFLRGILVSFKKTLNGQSPFDLLLFSFKLLWPKKLNNNFLE